MPFALGHPAGATPEDCKSVGTVRRICWPRIDVSDTPRHCKGQQTPTCRKL